MFHSLFLFYNCSIGALKKKKVFFKMMITFYREVERLFCSLSLSLHGTVLRPGSGVTFYSRFLLLKVFFTTSESVFVCYLRFSSDSWCNGFLCNWINEKRRGRMNPYRHFIYERQQRKWLQGSDVVGVNFAWPLPQSTCHLFPRPARYSPDLTVGLFIWISKPTRTSRRRPCLSSW